MLGAGALGRPRGMEWGGRREEGSGWAKDLHAPRALGWGGVGAEVSGQSETSATGWEPPTAGVPAPQDRLAISAQDNEEPQPSIFPSIRVFPNDSVLPIRWPQYWSFSLWAVPTQWLKPLTDQTPLHPPHPTPALWGHGGPLAEFSTRTMQV